MTKGNPTNRKYLHECEEHIQKGLILILTVVEAVAEVVDVAAAVEVVAEVPQSVAHGKMLAKNDGEFLIINHGNIVVFSAVK